jgi:hypothetical protein
MTKKTEKAMIKLYFTDGGRDKVYYYRNEFKDGILISQQDFHFS